MSRVLVTADIHMKAWARYNKTENFRLEQFIKFAELMRDTCYQRSADTVIIAGDLLDELSPQPIVYQYLHKFLKILSEAAKVYIISGNHDMSKNIYDKQNAYYPVLKDSNFGDRVEYLHDEFRIIGGRRFYFRGWEPALRPFPDTDVLITHAYIGGGVLPSGLKIKDGDHINGKYKTAFIGDIHKHQTIGQVIVPGCPVQNSFSDDPNTGFIFFDTDTFKWEHVSTADDGRFLRFRYDDNDEDIQMEIRAVTEHDLQDPADARSASDKLFEKYNIVYRQREVKDKAKPFEIKNIGAISITDILNELIKDFQYKDELLGVIGQGSHALESFIQQELKVTLKDIEIVNFKSIAYFKMEFASLNKLTLITGQNGAGKSTFLQALMWALTGESPSEVDDVIQSGKTYCEVKLSVEYQNNKIYIERSRGSKFEFKVKTTSSDDAGRWVASSSKADLQKHLENMLPIVTKLHLLYLNQSRDGFLSELNDAARVSLMSELSGQSVVAGLTVNVEEHVAKLKSKSDAEDAKYNELHSKLTALQSQLDDAVTDPSNEIAALDKDINCIKSDKLGLINDRSELADALRKEFEAVETDIRGKVKKVEEQQRILAVEFAGLSKDITAYENIRNKKLSWVCPTCKTVKTATDITEKDIEDAKEKLSELYVKRGDINKKKMEYDSLVGTANAKLNSARATLQKKIAEAVKTIDAGINGKELEEARIRSKLNGLMEQMGRFKKNLEIKDTITALESKLVARQGFRDAAKEKFTAFKKLGATVFGDDGLMSAAILERIATAINNDPEVKILTTKRLKNGKLKPTLNLELKVNNEFLPYNLLSGGERLRVDVWFLNRMVALVSGISFMALDETLKYADPVNAEKMLQNLIDADIKNIFLVYHGVVPAMLTEHPDVSFMQVSKIGGDSVYNVSSF